MLKANKDSIIAYHHIGGRNGTFPLPLKRGKLLNDFHLLLYDADSDCLEQMKAAEKSSWGKVSVYPYGIGSKTGPGTFNINFHATTSSLYKFNDAFADYNYVINPNYGEYRVGDACQFIKAVNIKLFSLEDALNQSENNSLDFLSMDVQGAEYDVLLGAKEFLKKNCLGMQLEVEFLEIYKGQKTFLNINSLMEKMGFELVELNSFGRLSSVSLPIGFRGSEQPLHAEAVYLKKFSALAAEKNAKRIYKWALLALIYGKVSLCFQGLEALSALDNLQKPSPTDASYIQLLKKAWKIFLHEKNHCLPKLSEIFSYEEFQAFYSGNTVKNTEQLKTKKATNKYLFETYAPLLDEIREKKGGISSAFEDLLLAYGLDEVAQSVKKNRELELKSFFCLIGSLDQDNVKSDTEGGK